MDRGFLNIFFLNMLNIEVFQIFYFIWMTPGRTEVLLILLQVYFLKITGILNEKLSQTFI